MDPIRFTGLSSGLDTQSIVDELMKAARMPLDNKEKDKQLLEWKRDDYREMNSQLAELDDTIFDGIGKESTFVQKNVSSSNESAVSARNINSSIEVNTTIRVDQLAETAYMNSANNITANTNFNPNDTLNNQRANLNTDFTSSTFTIQAINEDGTLGDVETFTIDPSTDSLNDVIKDINTSSANVVAFFDEHTGKVSISAKNTGKVTGDAELILTGDFLTGTLGLDDNNNVASDNGNGKKGENAKFEFNGLVTERSSNTFRINGYEYTLKGVTDDGDGITEAGETVNITSETDVDSIFDEISDFVDKYNEIIEKINDEIDEKRDYDYKPLTDEEKDAMSDDEIEKWEDAARAGTLSNDSILRSALNKMRNDLYSPVNGVNSDYNQLSEIGITTSSNTYDNGKLEINENKLKEALSNNAMDVYNLFNIGSSDDDFNDIGIVDRLRKTIDSAMDSIDEKAGNENSVNTRYSMGRQIINMEQEIDDFEDYLENLEQRYWSQYTALETAMANSNSQIESLFSYLQ